MLFENDVDLEREEILPCSWLKDSPSEKRPNETELSIENNKKQQKQIIVRKKTKKNMV